jgi:8-oxo-dGTP pyrophosphatase MutT (NUDIX family)
MTRGLPIRDAVSAGGVVWRRDARGELQVVLCGRTKENLWGLPKGTPDAGETMEQTALREVREETGLEVEPGAKLGVIRYWFTLNGERVRKQVHHWLMTPVGGDIADHDHEFDDVRWLPMAEAQRLITFTNERKMLHEAATMLGDHS